MPENNYELEFELSDGSKKTAIITIPQGPMGPTGPAGPQGPQGNANVRTGSVTVSSSNKGTAVSVSLGAQPKLVQLWTPSGELVSCTITRTSTGFSIISNYAETFTYCAVM